MQNAWWLTVASGGIVALIAGWFSRGNALFTRKTDVDKIYSARIDTLEKTIDTLRNERDALQRVKDAESDALRDRIQVLREQHLIDMGAREELHRMEEQCSILKRRLMAFDPQDGDNDAMIGL